MGRGISRDRLSDETAKRVREVLREARKLKGITNAQITEHMGWEDPRRVIDMLAGGRPLREANAHALLIGLLEMRPRNAVADKLLREEMKLVGPFWAPPVLIASWAYDEFAEFLANELSRKPGIRAKRCEEFARNVRYSIGRTARGMAGSFFNDCWTYFNGDQTAGEVLKLFGYTVPDDEKQK